MIPRLLISFFLLLLIAACKQTSVKEQEEITEFTYWSFTNDSVSSPDFIFEFNVNQYFHFSSDGKLKIAKRNKMNKLEYTIVNVPSSINELLNKSLINTNFCPSCTSGTELPYHKGMNYHVVSFKTSNDKLCRKSFMPLEIARRFKDLSSAIAIALVSAKANNLHFGLSKEVQMFSKQFLIDQSRKNRR